MKLSHWGAKTSIVFFFFSHFAAVAAQSEMLEQSLLTHYPAGSISTIPTAKAALAEVDAVRGEVERRFADGRAACLEKFFTSQCIAEAKELRRAALYNIRKVEVEANAFLRKERAAERERTISERQSRAVRPLDGPSIPISGAARESSHAAPEPADNSPSQAEKP
mgnify:FL=1